MTDTDESDPDGGLVTRDSLLFALVLVVGIAGSGVIRRQLGLLGYDQLGRIVFVLGYGGMVFVIWYGWVRPLDITGPTGNADDSVQSSDGATTDGREGTADAARDADAGSGTDGRTER